MSKSNHFRVVNISRIKVSCNMFCLTIENCVDLKCMEAQKKWFDERTRWRIFIVAALIIGYYVVAVLRSGTAW